MEYQDRAIGACAIIPDTWLGEDSFLFNLRRYLDRLILSAAVGQIMESSWAPKGLIFRTRPLAPSLFMWSSQESSGSY